jgi:L-threonylcarbamoyladenylate synthase
VDAHVQECQGVGRVMNTTAPAAIAEAAERLRRGEVVAFPTETVYGLGALATHAGAVERVFAIKNRPVDHPLIVHLASAHWLGDWARDIPAAARRLAQAFWPGPLTLVLPRQPLASDLVTGGHDTVALRVPAHPVALALIGAAGALVAPSANRFGRLSPTLAAHVEEQIGGQVDMILDGGPCAVGVESTIVSVLSGEPALLRPGGITVAQIEAVLGRALGAAPSAVRAPGRLASHYAPVTPMEVLPGADLVQRIASLTGQGLRVAVMALRSVEAPLAPPGLLHRCDMPVEAAAYAQALFATLHELDKAGFDWLLVEAPPEEPQWLAVRDRLARAATPAVPA